MRYIDTWLSGLGLEYVIPKLKANGITTPKKLATLSLRDIYEVVGVENSEDRKKLFFLIQRLQTILQNKSQGTKGSTAPESDGEDETTNSTPPKASEVEPTLDQATRASTRTKSVEKVRPKSQIIKSSKSSLELVNNDTKPHLLRANSAAALSEPVKRVEAVLQHKKLGDSLDSHGSGVLLLSPGSPKMLPTEKQAKTKNGAADHSSVLSPPVSRSYMNLQEAHVTPPVPPIPAPAPPARAHAPANQPAPAALAPSNFKFEGPPHSDVQDMPIRVVVRKRPLSKQELARGERDVMEVRPKGLLLVHEPKVKVDLTKYVETQNFIFDDAFDGHESNEAIYSRTVRPLVSFLFDGGKATCFAYGQTGSGKTFSMMGSNPGNPHESTSNQGLYVLAGKDIFSTIHRKGLHTVQVLVSCFEIYGGKLFDLLNGRGQIKCLEDAKQQVQLPGLTQHVAGGVEELLLLMAKAHSQRSTGSTGANAESSRSHQILQIVLNDSRRGKGVAKLHCVGGKLSFIDLAGSERGADTHHSSKQTRIEGAEINTSLLALKEVIRSLEKKHGHTPFRGSKLTQVLKDSFVGDKSRTCMMACVSPSNGNCEHTLNTLRYADRVKEHNSTSDNDRPSQSPVQMPIPEDDHYLPDAPASRHTDKGDLSAEMSKLRLSPEKLSSVPPVSDPHLKALFPSRDIRDRSSVGRSMYHHEHHVPTKVANTPSEELGGTELIRKTVNLLAAHKLSIAEMVEVMKDEMELVQEMESVDDRDTEIYLEKLERILDVKSVAIVALKDELDSYQRYRSF